MTYAECISMQSEVINIWNQFIICAKRGDDAFPKSFTELLQETFQRIPIYHINNNEFYRARIVSSINLLRKVKTESVNFNDMTSGHSGIYGLPKEDMSAPPPEKASSGRANNKNVSCLYIADSPTTACAEVKPKIDELVSVCRYKVPNNVKLANFCSLSSCRLSDLNKSAINDAKIIEFMKYVLCCYSDPVNHDDEYKYVASQIITQFFRERNFDGVVYESGLNQQNAGYNIALFDPQKASFVKNSSELYMCTRNIAEFQNLSLSNSKSCTASTEDKQMVWSEIALLNRDLSNIN